MPTTCLNCGAPLAYNARFCVECGATLPPAGDVAKSRPANAYPADQAASRRAYQPPETFPDGQPVWQKPAYRQPDWEAAPPENAGPYMDEWADAPDPDADAYERPPADSKWAPVSIGAYIGLLLLFLIPGLNILTMIIWACGASKKRGVTNFARASLITIAIVAIAIFGVLFYLINYTEVGQLLDLLINANN